MVKKCICILFSLFLIFGLFVMPASAVTPPPFSVTAEGYVLASLDNGYVLAAKNADNKLYPASLTKLMTAIVVLDSCDDLSEQVTCTSTALNPLLGTGSSVFNLVDGETLTVEQLLNVLLIRSANDAANVLAEYVGGSIEGFIDLMNKKAISLGMTSSHFANAHGLHDDSHYTTPNDLLKLMKYATKNEDFCEMIGKRRYTVPATDKNPQRIAATTVFMQDPNSQMPSTYYKPTTGGKTGFTDEAGRCLITTARKNGQSFVCILMKCPATNADGAYIRNEFAESKQFFEWAFNDFEYKTVYEANEPVEEFTVKYAKENDHVTVVLQRAVNAVMEKAADNSTLQVDVTLKDKEVKAPINKGDILGNATVKYRGEIIDTVPVIALNAVEKDPLNADVIKEAISGFFSHPIVKGILYTLLFLIVGFVLYCIAINIYARKRRRRRRRRR